MSKSKFLTITVLLSLISISSFALGDKNPMGKLCVISHIESFECGNNNYPPVFSVGHGAWQKLSPNQYICDESHSDKMVDVLAGVLTENAIHGKSVVPFFEQPYYPGYTTGPDHVYVEMHCDKAVYFYNNGQDSQITPITLPDGCTCKGDGL